MLILRRKEGQWVEVRHKSGDTVRIRVYNIRSRCPGQLDLAFDDPDHLFTIQRPERGTRPPDPTRDADAKPPGFREDPRHPTIPVTVDMGPFAVDTAASQA